MTEDPPAGLVPCRKSGRPISPEAESCPQCGHPSAAKKIGDLGEALKGCGCLLMLTGLLLLALLLFMLL